ncbi:hypothetical protein Daura_16270 [Dactylosporangium aurantiacum]|uniref:Uncharacterized protein n=1 Tax=Dactylosporangium aurantiacum TaxID=35754 RepID=A0A9Q9IQI9_9ACTN|nr:DUF3592 domain-containing protein [Dactylosporangium aurantiacum]MDG6103062.1 hypothetical protein [Dactylosporangium aurantiacum]UWZ57574.1 hypothetical protein Daura_16270 [Dactylosporangium aurantiacum]
MSSLNSGAGQARLVGCILTAVAAVMVGVTALLFATLPASPTSDDLIAAAAVAAVTVVLFAVGVPLFVVGARRLARQRRVLRTGTPCLATVVAAHRVTDPDNDRPVAKILLAVPAAGHGTVTATVRQVVPPVLTRIVRPGAVLPVRVDPADPTFAVIDWEHAQQRHRIAGDVGFHVATDIAGALLFG